MACGSLAGWNRLWLKGVMSGAGGLSMVSLRVPILIALSAMGLCVLSASGQQLPPRQRARANGPETLAGTVPFEMLGEAQRHPAIVEAAGAVRISLSTRCGTLTGVANCSDTVRPPVPVPSGPRGDASSAVKPNLVEESCAPNSCLWSQP